MMDGPCGGSSSEEETGDCELPPRTRDWLQAAQRGDQELLATMIAEAATSDSDGGVCTGVASLLSLSDGDGYTALHRAAYEGHTGAIRLLLVQ